MRAAGVVIVVIFLALLVVMLGGSASTYQMVNADEVFVYAESGQAVVVLQSGEYNAPATITTGCYKLTAPRPGQQRGEMERVGEVCE